ncbi:MAG: RNA-binding protein, partial [Acidimicrobiia bacterium]
MNIFVGNLSFRATNGDLEQLFGEYGAVDSAA